MPVVIMPGRSSSSLVDRNGREVYGTVLAGVKLLARQSSL